jgi:hypothetical protein
MMKVTSNGIIEEGKVRDKLPEEDIEEIARMFGLFEHGLPDVEGDNYDGQTVIYE